MLPVKNLLKGLFAFVEDGTFPFRPGILRDGENNPIMDITSLLPSETDAAHIQETARRLLNLAASGNIEGLEIQINIRGSLQYSLFSHVTGTAIMVPCVERAEQLPYAIMSLARIADTGSGDSLAHRISKCEWCGKFFLRKTKKPSKYNTHACRVKASNRERLKSGWFKDYYLRVRKKREASRPPFLGKKKDMVETTLHADDL